MVETRGTFVLDHVLLGVSRDGPEVAPLVAAGFTEGSPNTHPGQGTACRRFFFENAYLEFAWIEDEAEVRSPIVAPTGLSERLGGARGASRIALCVRLPEAAAPPVATWPYRPPYLPAGFSISMARSSDRVEEPLLFFLRTPPGRRGAVPGHENGSRAISRVVVFLPPDTRPSPELDWLADSGLVEVGRGRVEYLRVEVDGGARGERLSVAGGSPLELIW